MEEPKRHHLVPRCYLKKFGKNKRKEWYVEAYDKTKVNSRIFEVSIRKICVQTEYYTINKLPDEQKRFLEKFYANNIEANYPEIYDILTDPRQIKLTNKQRFSIITFVISQVLRTSKFATGFNKFWSESLAKGYRMMDFDKGIDKINFEGGGVIDFKGKTFEQVKKEEEQKNIEMINIGNLKRFYEISLMRLKDGIAVKKIHPTTKLITSDNPAYFDHNIYDPTGFIRLPLDENHLLMILPYSKEQYFKPKGIVRSFLNEEWSYMDVHYNNIFQIENSERYIIGKRASIEESIKFFENLDPNDFAEKCKKVSEKAQEMLLLAEKLFKQ